MSAQRLVIDAIGLLPAIAEIVSSLTADYSFFAYYLVSYNVCLANSRIHPRLVVDNSLLPFR